MTTRTLVDSLRDFIGRRRILATRRAAIEQIARQPGHLAADVNVPRRYTPAGITVVIISAIGCCRDQLDEIPPKALETPEPTQRLRFFTSVTSQTGYFHR